MIFEGRRHYGYFYALLVHWMVTLSFFIVAFIAYQPKIEGQF
jgi:hypothetical protein